MLLLLPFALGLAEEDEEEEEAASLFLPSLPSGRQEGNHRLSTVSP